MDKLIVIEKNSFRLLNDNIKSVNNKWQEKKDTKWIDIKDIHFKVNHLSDSQLTDLIMILKKSHIDLNNNNEIKNKFEVLIKDMIYLLCFSIDDVNIKCDDLENEIKILSYLDSFKISSKELASNLLYKGELFYNLKDKKEVNSNCINDDIIKIEFGNHMFDSYYDKIKTFFNNNNLIKSDIKCSIYNTYKGFRNEMIKNDKDFILYSLIPFKYFNFKNSINKEEEDEQYLLFSNFISSLKTSLKVFYSELINRKFERIQYTIKL